MIMKDMPYLLQTHYLVKAMQNICFPATKAQIMEEIGNERIPVCETEDIPIGNLLTQIEMESFSCAAEFYCAYNAFVK